MAVVSQRFGEKIDINTSLTMYGRKGYNISRKQRWNMLINKKFEYREIAHGNKDVR